MQVENLGKENLLPASPLPTMNAHPQLNAADFELDANGDIVSSFDLAVTKSAAPREDSASIEVEIEASCRRSSRSCKKEKTWQEMQEEEAALAQAKHLIKELPDQPKKGKKRKKEHDPSNPKRRKSVAAKGAAKKKGAKKANGRKGEKKKTGTKKRKKITEKYGNDEWDGNDLVEDDDASRSVLGAGHRGGSRKKKNKSKADKQKKKKKKKKGGKTLPSLNGPTYGPKPFRIIPLTTLIPNPLKDAQEAWQEEQKNIAKQVKAAQKKLKQKEKRQSKHLEVEEETQAPEESRSGRARKPTAKAAAAMQVTHDESEVLPLPVKTKKSKAASDALTRMQFGGGKLPAKPNPDLLIPCCACPKSWHVSCLHNHRHPHEAADENKHYPYPIKKGDKTWRCPDCENGVESDVESDHLENCTFCSEEGELLLCDRCPRAFHLYCVDLKTAPPGTWHCPVCTSRGLSVSATSQSGIGKGKCDPKNAKSGSKSKSDESSETLTETPLQELASSSLSSTLDISSEQSDIELRRQEKSMLEIERLCEAMPLNHFLSFLGTKLATARQLRALLRKRDVKFAKATAKCKNEDALLERLHHKALLHERSKLRTCRACGEWGPLYEDDIAQFHREGVVLLREVMTPRQVELCFEEVVNRFNAVTTTITNMGLNEVLQRDGFQEFKMRNEGRYDMELPFLDTEEFSFITNKAPWMPTVKKILGKDCKLVHKGCMLSKPGSINQPEHCDGYHVVTNKHQPAHCLNVFIPLCDLNSKNGATEFVPSTHILGNWESEITPVEVFYPAGTPLLFDYRLRHRGMGNNSNELRPLIYITYAKPFFVDKYNFSKARYKRKLPPIERLVSREERLEQRRNRRAKMTAEREKKKQVGLETKSSTKVAIDEQKPAEKTSNTPNEERPSEPAENQNEQRPPPSEPAAADLTVGSV